ncbi:unnamed protein product [Clonostachys rosea f. rosea IK726]|uniref:AB hydrolase-1 domain-containing protein n=2 Tax=Bionectria ochroleuca TaxID=29856 RepID=A0A0B7K4R6_BIOOC|nr:unnamed protein product [Clonostachys rosea f. rosea IK726]
MVAPPLFRHLPLSRRCWPKLIQVRRQWRQGLLTNPQNPQLARQLHSMQWAAPPLILTGLFLALWSWKCMMMVLFQNTIIYNPFMPPNARSMKIEDFKKQCRGTQWREERIRSLDGTEIALCISDDPAPAPGVDPKTPVYILYFQGNASSLPPRLPDLSWVIRTLREGSKTVSYTMVCLSYRGYWTSHDRPSETGINKDAEAALRWISSLHHRRDPEKRMPDPVTILYGQSVGCGFATNLAATTETMPIHGLVLETPFESTRAMLKALYPQKWLPYQHLWPFLRNHLDTWTNMGVIASRSPPLGFGVSIVEAAKDELVPSEHGDRLFKRCQDVGIPVERQKVRGAYHNDAIVRMQGKTTVVHSIASVVARIAQNGPRNGGIVTK